MQYILSKQFEKQFTKLPKRVKTNAVVVFENFVENPDDASLRNHRLIGKWKGYFSINITSDIRAVYIFLNENTVHFIAIGSHSELYS